MYFFASQDCPFHVVIIVFFLLFIGTQHQPMTDAHFYFQCEDDPNNLVLVDAALFTAGNVSGWFSNVFGSDKFRRTPPVGEKDKLPMYYLPIPRAVVLELVRAMRFPVLIDDMVRHVPLSIKSNLSLATWRQYLDYYGFTPAKAAEPKLDGTLVRETARGRVVRLEGCLPFKYARRVAEALVGEIKLKHPDYAAYTAGQTSRILCEFLSVYEDTPYDTYRLPLPGEPVVKPISVAWYLAHRLMKGNVWDWDDHMPSDLYFKYCFERAMGECVSVDMVLVLARQSRAKRPFKLAHWPSLSQSLEASTGNYEVLRMTVVRRSPLSNPASYEDEILRSAERRLKIERSSAGGGSSSDDDVSSEASSDE